MNIRTEGIHTAEFLISEGNGQISRDVITLAAGPALDAGTVLALNTTRNEYGAYSSSGENGLNKAVGVLFAGVPASTENRKAVAIVRQAEVRADLMTGLDDAGSASLEQREIIIR